MTDIDATVCRCECGQVFTYPIEASLDYLNGLSDAHAAHGCDAFNWYELS